jgi:hypothetical protein
MKNLLMSDNNILPRMGKRHISDNILCTGTIYIPIIALQAQLKFNCYLPEVCYQQLTLYRVNFLHNCCVETPLFDFHLRDNDFLGIVA